ncbi:MAG: hypothetical protein K2X47_07785 [Bdellovibrionales bacterium]|nr:hypothetical protein [Bdellovibrionales bacterium]
MKAKTVLFFSVPFMMLTFFLGPQLKDKLIHTPKEESIQLSSIGSICSRIAFPFRSAESKKSFDLQKFHTCIEQFSNRSPKQISDNFEIKSPEELLAVLEIYSDQRELLNYSQIINQLTESELQKINQNLLKFIHLKKISEKSILKLLVQLHKLIHPSKGLRDAFGNDSPILENLNQMEEKALIDRTELTIATQNLLQVFAEFGALKLPGSSGRLGQFLRRHKKNAIKGLVFGIFAASAATRGTVPKYLPLFDTFDPREISQKRWTEFKAGEAPEIRHKLDLQLRLIFLTKLYNLGARISLIIFLTNEITQFYENRARPLLQQKQVEVVQVMERASQRLESPSVRTDLIFEKYLDTLAEGQAGEWVNPDLPEHQKMKELFRETSLATWESNTQDADSQ